MDAVTNRGSGAVPTPRAPGLDDAELVRRLRARDESAFAAVVDAWTPAMLAVARGYVSTPESAREAVQDAWVAVLRGLASFEGRSSLRTWAFAILVNVARNRGVRESRVLPFSTAFPEDAGPTVDPAAFRGPADRWAGGWTPEAAPQPWQDSPEARAVARETGTLVAAAVERLPDRQRLVITLRDVEGCTAAEVCRLLGLTAENQRVLLHRARAAVRAALDGYYRGAPEGECS